MSHQPSPERRLSFGQVAELYEQVRPSYPRELVEDVIAYAQLEQGEQILDVGAGTGKATRLFAAAGYPVVALEPNPEMAAVARTACAAYPAITVIESDFEHWDRPGEPFELLISAQAWHWIDPEVRYRTARAALKTGGALALFWNFPDWQDVPLRPALDEAYRDAEPKLEQSGPMNPLTQQGGLVAEWEAEIHRAPGFEQRESRVYRWRCRYTAQEYVRLLSTHSDHVMLDSHTRQELFDRVQAAIESQGGELVLPYVTRLCLARTE